MSRHETYSRRGRVREAQNWIAIPADSSSGRLRTSVGVMVTIWQDVVSQSEPAPQQTSISSTTGFDMVISSREASKADDKGRPTAY